MSRYIGSSLLPNSPCFPPGSKTTGFALLVKKMISQTSANSPTAVATPGKPGNNMIEDTGYWLRRRASSLGAGGRLHRFQEFVAVAMLFSKRMAHRIEMH